MYIFELQWQPKPQITLGKISQIFRHHANRYVVYVDPLGREQGVYQVRYFLNLKPFQCTMHTGHCVSLVLRK